MAEKDQKLAESNPSGAGDAYASSLGNAPEVSKTTLDSDNHVITSVDQGLSVIQTLEWDAQKLVKNAAKITSLKQGRRPYDSKRLEKQGKGYKTNISPGTFSTTLRRVAPRLYMPILNASTLTAAELPAGTPNAEEKTAHYRDTITRAIRSWPRWNVLMRLLAQEVVDYGFAFAAFTDKYEWRPHLCRMDRGFVPAGTEIMDLEPAFFELMWDYQPSQLLNIAKAAVDAGVEGWHKDNVAYAVQQSKPATAPSREPTGWRKWEEMVREQIWNYATSKNYRVVEAKHLFALESSGKVSHYIFNPDAPENQQLLYEKHDAYDSMADVVIPVVFNSTDGTIHGSWGAGHLLYDLGGLQEKIFCDMVDNLRNANKQRLQVNDPKDINDVKQVVNDTEVIVSGAQFANNLGGVQQNVEAYIKLKDILQQTMDSKVGAYVPPIPSQPGDVKAAQINAAMMQEKEVSEDSVEHFLSYIAYIVLSMSRRLTNADSPDKKAKEVLFELKKKLTDEEIEIFRSQPAVRSVTDFTPQAAQSRAAFATQFMGNQLFKQNELARLAAEGVPGGGIRLADLVVVQEGDETQTTIAQRQQTMENATMLQGMDVPVVVTDNHWVHMQTLKDPLIQAINGIPTNPAMLSAATIGLKHYAAHWTAGVAQKVLPDEAINAEKSFIADAEKAIQQGQMQQQQQQMLQQQQQAQLPPGGV
jgi:hypothetical protein